MRAVLLFCRVVYAKIPSTTELSEHRWQLVLTGSWAHRILRFTAVQSIAGLIRF
jgi:hypothetical protein